MVNKVLNVSAKVTCTLWDKNSIYLVFQYVKYSECSPKVLFKNSACQLTMFSFAPLPLLLDVMGKPTLFRSTDNQKIKEYNPD